MFDVGRMCIKVAGREAGKYCVVVKKLDSNFVLVTGPRSVTSVKRRKCNILHLEPLKESLKIKDDASDEEVIKAYEEASIFTKLDLQKPDERGKAHAPSVGGRQAEEREEKEKPEKKAKKKKEAE
jgi:large subunit ribosomal protein L14e